MFVISPQSKCVHCRLEACGVRAHTHAHPPQGNIKSLRKSIWALGAESRDGRSSGAALRRPEISSWCREPSVSRSWKTFSRHVSRKIYSKSNNHNGENHFKYDCTILFGCEFQAGFEKRREQERSACSPFKQQSSAWTYLLAAAPTRSYLLAPPQPKEIGFWCFVFFHSTSWSFISCLVLTVSMLWCLLCVESPFQLCDCGNLRCP